jgi:hypothetical protein
VDDGRAAAVLRLILEASGVRTLSGQEPGQSEIWILQPKPCHLEAAREWRATRPHARLVLVGEPTNDSKADWERLHPVTIRNPDDFRCVRQALGRALQAAETEATAHA